MSVENYSGYDDIELRELLRLIKIEVTNIEHRLIELARPAYVDANLILSEMKAREESKRKIKKEVGLPIIIECGGVRYARTKK